MNRAVLMCCGVPVLMNALAAALVAAVEEPEQELLRFQGRWQAVSLQLPSGEMASREDLEKTHLVVDGNKFTLSTKDSTISGTFTIDPATSPKAIDAVLLSDDGRETRFLGIYEMQGDKRKSCFALPSSKRPDDFEPGQGYLHLEWKKESTNP